MSEPNIHYASNAIAEYFSAHRIKWSDFYESERRVIAESGLGSATSVLDVGCGCGGLGLALHEKFHVADYTGVEINPQAAAIGHALNPQARIVCGDVLDLTRSHLRDRQFDVVFSLSCVDWNVRFEEMFGAAWNHVRPGGHLISTFRLTEHAGCNDMSRSRQFINYRGQLEGELAPYVVLNARDLMAQLERLHPAAIRAFGYWGAPSATALTPYDRLCFAAFAVRKRIADEQTNPTKLLIDLPAEIRKLMEAR